MYAIIETGGKQYRVAAKDRLRMEKLPAEPGEEVLFERVLLVGSDEGVEVGKPFVEGARVRARVVDRIRGPKIVVFKKKRRKDYKKKQGHRQWLTVVEIERIERD